MTHPFVRLQRVLPQHGLSRSIGTLAASRQRHLKRFLIDRFIAAYSVDLTDCEGDSAADYASFNDFFARRLKPGTRPMPDDPRAIASPADGTVSQVGAVRDGRLLPAKGRAYRLAELLDDADFAASLAGGYFLTIYLAPHDYHRVHAPNDATLLSTVEVPGRLFSVNSVTERHVPGLFAHNERLVLRLGAAFGEFALVLVGAMIVASIEVAWPDGPQSPYRQRRASVPAGVRFRRGDEVGAFLMGSTVIAVFPPSTVAPVGNVEAGTVVKVGTPVATAA